MSKHHDQSPARDIEAAQHNKATLGKPGKAKGYSVEVSHGQRSRTSPLPGMLTMTDVHGVPVADAPLPIDPTIQGKHQPACMVHPGMTRKQIAGASFNGEDILKEAMGNTGRHGLPLKSEED